jgi:HemY protein
MNTSLAVAAFAVLIGIALLLSRWIGLTVRGPETFAAYRRERRKSRGLAALSRGMVAVAAGDSAQVRKLAARARKLLDEPAMTLLLSAQAAQMDGLHDAAEDYYRDMLASEETEFLGLRGLFLAAVRKGDRAAAEDYATRAFELRPDAPWVSTALFELHSAHKNWAAAADLLDASVKAKLVAADVAKRRRAVLLTEQARAADAKGAAQEALDAAQKALGLSPGFAPAALVGAKYLIEQGKTWKAAEVIETAWSVNPHPDLAVLYGKAKSGEGERAHAKWVRGLADFNKDHIESRLLRAAQNIALQQWKGARKALKGLVDDFATVRVSELMAQIERGENPDTEQGREAAQLWLKRAVSAPRDAHWMCGTCGRESLEWQAICSNCGAFDGLSWQAPNDLILAPAEFGDEVEDESLGAVVVREAQLEDQDLPQDAKEPSDREPNPGNQGKMASRPMSYTRLIDEEKREANRDLSNVRAPDDPGPRGGASTDDPFDPRPQESFEQDW